MRAHALAPVLALTFALTLSTDYVRTQEAPPAPLLTDEQMEEFLRTARVVRSRILDKGITGSLRATLTDGTLTHDAHIQNIYERKTTFRGRDGLEFNFRDSWHFNVAAYKIDRLLDLQLVPVAVQRSWKGSTSAFSWWVDDVLMDEGERLKQKLLPPNMACWSEQTRLLRMFDQLIDNSDRNVGNTLITKRWRLWAIDHTRAFRYSKTPRNPASLTGIDRKVLARLEALDFETIKVAVERHLTDADIRNLLERRDAMVAHYKARGSSTLYDRRDPLAGCAGT
jgi:hypothetical protein